MQEVKETPLAQGLCYCKVVNTCVRLWVYACERDRERERCNLSKVSTV